MNLADTVAVHKLLSAGATSTATQNSASAMVDDASKLCLHAMWTPGAGSNVLTMKIYFSHSDSNVADADAIWFQEMTWTAVAGTKTRTLIQLDHTAASGAEIFLRYDLPDPSIAKRIRVTYSETVSAGTLSLRLLSKAV